MYLNQSVWSLHGIYHVVVDDFSDARVQRNLLRRQDRDEVLVDDSRLLLDLLRIALTFQLLTGLPE